MAYSRGTIGDEELGAVTDALVALHQRYYGRKPRTAKSTFMGDDMVVCLLGEIYTDVEKTMIEMQREALVHQTRREFQVAMRPRFVRAVEQATNRRVAEFFSTHHVGPDLELEVFLLAPFRDAADQRTAQS